MASPNPDPDGLNELNGVVGVPLAPRTVWAVGSYSKPNANDDEQLLVPTPPSQPSAPITPAPPTATLTLTAAPPTILHGGSVQLTGILRQTVTGAAIPTRIRSARPGPEPDRLVIPCGPAAETVRRLPC